MGTAISRCSGALTSTRMTRRFPLTWQTSYAMKIIAAASVLVLLTHLATAQAHPRSRYHIRVQLFNDKAFQGQLISLNDSSVRMIKYRPLADTVISVKAIRNFSLRRKDAPTLGFLTGLGIGAGLGAAFGYVSYSPRSCGSGFCLDFGPELNAIGGAVVGGVVGGLIGAASRSSFKPHPINGSQEAYAMFRKKMLEESASRRVRKGKKGKTVKG